MRFAGPLTGIQLECERVLRTLPRWFGIEESLLEYARNTVHLPTFAVEAPEGIVGFVSLQKHFEAAWEVNCMAIAMHHRGRGLGKELHRRAEEWLVSHGASMLQVKTLASTHPSPEYAETRKFYETLGYEAVEVFPSLWGEGLPVLQLAKWLPRAVKPLALAPSPGNRALSEQQT